jgi:hypothetical protein
MVHHASRARKTSARRAVRLRRRSSPAFTSAGLENPLFRWSGVLLAASVSIAAGFTGYFKFRERGFNQQQTADAMEKEYNAVDLRVGDYTNNDEQQALKTYAEKVETMKEEQRKRELQLEQSSTQHDNRYS